MKRIKKNHHLKIYESYFKQYIEEDKTFEIRVNDRNYIEGDTVTMYVEDKPELGVIHGEISYITNFMLQAGYVAFALKNIRIENAANLKS